MLLFLHIAGGVTLILFGVRFLRKGLDRTFGPMLGHWLQRMARSNLRAFIGGIGIAAVAPSSTTISILAVQLVQAGHLGSRQMMSVMLGANIGMTLMVILIAMRLEQHASLLLLAGVPMFQYCRRSSLRGTGQIMLSLGLIFLAIGIITKAGRGFDPSGDFVRLMSIIEAYPFALATVIAAMAVVLQSSTAAIAVLMGLSGSGVVDMGLVIPGIIGANVGLSVITAIVGWSHYESRRLAIGNLVAKTVIAIILLSFMTPLLATMTLIPLTGDALIAAAHSGFNVLVAIVFLPLVAPLHLLVCHWTSVPEHKDERDLGPRYISQHPVEGFSLAIGQCRREILRVSEIVRTMLIDIWTALEHKNLALAKDVQDRDNQIDLLDAQIKRFLTELSSQEPSDEESLEIISQMRFISELETIGDIIDRNIADVAIKRIRQRITFSSEGWQELCTFHQTVADNALVAETAFATRDASLARRLLDQAQVIRRLEERLRDNHFARLQTGHHHSYESSSAHLDLLTHLKRINSCATHVANAILHHGQVEAPSSTVPTHDLGTDLATDT